jgi:hypothetical protein
MAARVHAPTLRLEFTTFCWTMTPLAEFKTKALGFKF